jgi:5-methyltetrahydropteroyltriglutamate--homocysteine methyltransferase
MESSHRLILSDHSAFPISQSSLVDPEGRRQAFQASIEAQVRAGLNIVTVGHGGSANPLEILIEGLEGLTQSAETAPLTIWGEIRGGTLTGPVHWTQPLFREDLKRAHEISGLPVKVSFVGPLTLASLTQDPKRVYGSLGARIEAFARALAHEVEGLVEQGVNIIQVEEPWVLHRPTDFPRLREGLTSISEVKGEARLALGLTGKAICPLYDWFQNLPLDMLMLDLIQSPKLVNMISDRETSLTLGLGIVDHRSSALESSEDMTPLLDLLLDGISAEKIYLQPAGSLAFLSPAEAEAKLANLAAIAREYWSKRTR